MPVAVISRDAAVARLPLDAPAKERSATLVLDPFGRLSVEISFLGDGVQGLDVTFVHVADEHDMGGPVRDAEHPDIPQTKTTDARGRAHLDFLVPIGNYLCEISHQPAALVTTVEDVEKPFLLTLPIGRAWFDLQGEFKSKTT